MKSIKRILTGISVTLFGISICSFNIMLGLGVSFFGFLISVISSWLTDDVDN